MCEEVAVPTVPIYLISGERAKPVAKKLREVFDAVAVAPQLNLSSVLPSENTSHHFPGRMSQKVTKPGSVWTLSYAVFCVFF